MELAIKKGKLRRLLVTAKRRLAKRRLEKLRGDLQVGSLCKVVQGGATPASLITLCFRYIRVLEIVVFTATIYTTDNLRHRQSTPPTIYTTDGFSLRQGRAMLQPSKYGTIVAIQAVAPQAVFEAQVLITQLLITQLLIVEG